MMWGSFKKTLNGVTGENQFLRIVTVLLAIGILISGYGWIKKDVQIILVPPSIDEEMHIASSEASEGYKKAWGMFVASMMGNVTPGNASFISTEIGRLLAPDTYHRLRQDLAAQTEEIRSKQLAMSFQPRIVTYERPTNKVFVEGEFLIRAPGQQLPEKSHRTYEFVITIANRQPLVTWLNIYEGPARTERVSRNFSPEKS